MLLNQTNEYILMLYKVLLKDWKFNTTT